MNLEVFFVDTFTDKLFEGNPAGVVFHSEEIPSEMMQKMAAEHNLSETAFINTNKNNLIKFFAPQLEVDLCGHATMASAYIFFNHLKKESTDIEFQSNRGILRAEKTNDGVSIFLPKDNPRKIDNFQKFNQLINSEIVDVVRGIDDYLLILNSEVDVLNCRPNFSAIAKLDCRGLIVSAQGSSVDFVSRVFGPGIGIDEDPVTGSAHALLTTYWSKKVSKKHFKAKQLSSRGGYLECDLLGSKVKISGKARLYLKGEVVIS
tara:strand:+ start:188 stop:970 length:783 start_codon:yes stop_codon:yes gene_type:complete